MKPIVIDVEASGFGAGSYPIEVGVVLEDGGSYCVLIKPEPGWIHWDSAAAQVHGITRDLLMKHGQSVTTVAKQLNTLLSGMTVYTDAWAQDASWLDLLFEHAQQTRQFKLESLRRLLSEDQLEYWDDAKTEVLEILKIPRHRASADARILQMTVEQCTVGYRYVAQAV